MNVVKKRYAISLVSRICGGIADPGPFYLSFRNRASGAPSAGARKNSVLPKLASSSRSLITNNTPLTPLGRLLSSGRRMGTGSFVVEPLALASFLTFQSVFNAALDGYINHTGDDLINHPLSIKFESCGSPGDVLGVLQEQARVFREFREGNKKLMEVIEPAVKVLYSLSVGFPDNTGLVRPEHLDMACPG